MLVEWYNGLVIEKRNPNTICKVCGEGMYRRPSELEKRSAVFCSQVCYGKFQRKLTPCTVCRKPIRAGLNKKTCSRACANKNRKGISYNTGRLRDKVKSYRSLKFRLIANRGSACERCNYDKEKILQVHHKNRDRNNNELSNLELLCPNCHCEEHYLEKK